MISRNVLVFFKIVPEGHNHCQLSIVNCQFGEAAKQQFTALSGLADFRGMEIVGNFDVLLMHF